MVNRLNRQLLLVLLGTMLNANVSLAGNLVRLKDRPVAPPFHLMDIRGKPHDLSDYRGRVLIVNFWAPWCSPCIKLLKSMQRAADALLDAGAVILVIDVGGDKTGTDDFVRDYPVRFPLLIDNDQKLSDEWQLKTVIPTTFYIDREGRLAYRVRGIIDMGSKASLDTVRLLNN